jgi:multidrug resistance efflux pump
VSAEAPGVVERVSVRLGDNVARGQELVRLAPRELQLALERAQSALRQTEAQLGMSGEDSQPLPDEQIAAIRTAVANLDDARTQNQRAEQLAARGLLAGAEVEATRTKLKVAEAAYESAVETVRSLKASLQDRRAAYELAQKKLNDAVIRAPIAGAVAERLVQPGEFIKEDTPVVTLVEMDPLKVVTAAQEKFAGVIQPGMPIQFTVESYPNDMFRGRIVSVSPAVDQSTRTFAVEAELPNPRPQTEARVLCEGRHPYSRRCRRNRRSRRCDLDARRRVNGLHRRPRTDPDAERDDRSLQGEPD